MTAEDTLRRLLDEAAPEPPAGSAPPTAAPVRHRRSFAPLLAAAVVIALVAGVLMVRAAWPQHDSAPLATRSTPTPRQSTTSQVAQPPGTKVIGYYGITITVPTSWHVQPVLCNFFPTANSVIPATGEFAACPMQKYPPKQPDPNFTTVTLGTSDTEFQRSTTSPTTVGGVPARTATTRSRHSVTGLLVIASRQVVVSVTAPTLSRMRAVLDTVRIATSDTLGCVDRAVPLSGTVNAPASDLVPGTPTSAVVCQYNAVSRTQYRLVGSRALSSAATARLAERFDAASAATTTWHNGGQPVLARYVFRYAGGTTRTVDAGLDLQPAPVTDGHRAVEVDLSGDSQDLPAASSNPESSARHTT